MSDLEQLMDFPCDYTIKVLGLAGDEFVAMVHSVICRHAPDQVEPADVRPSSKGRFVSVNVTFRVQQASQLYAIHAELNGSAGVRMIM